MSTLKYAIFSLVLIASALGLAPAYAGEADPLFVSTTSDEAHRALMAFTFSKKQMERKHPVTVFLNERAVLVASKANTEKYKEQQELLTGIISGGGTVIICPACMKHYGVVEADILPGIKIGTPDLTGDALFKDNTKTMTW